jgi:hypothetical protein
MRALNEFAASMRSGATIAGTKVPQLLAVLLLLIGMAPPLITLFGRMGSARPEAYRIFDRLFFFNDHVGSIAMQAALMVAVMLPAVHERIARLAEAVAQRPGRACAIAFAGLALGARFVGHAHPFSMDEYAPVLQAHAFAHGAVAAHYPPEQLDRIVWPAFQGWFILVDKATGDAMSAYWPGLALVMAPFAAVHLEWLVNPAFTTLSLWLIGDLAVQASGDRSSRGWAMLVALASPQFTVNAMAFYAMPGLLALNLLYLWLLLQPGLRRAFLAGLVGGLALVLHNPVPHALMAVPCLAWLAMARERRPRLALVLLGYLPAGLLLGVGWVWLTAHLGLARRAMDATEAGLLQGWMHRVGHLFHRPTDDLLRSRYFATWKTWVWAAPGTLLFAGLALGKRREPVIVILAVAFALTYGFYFFVPFDQGHGWGYRYLHPVWAVVPLGAAAWIVRGGEGERALGAAVIAAGLLATPAFLWQTEATIGGGLAERIEAPAEGRWAVFVAPRHQYTNDLVQNPPGSERVRYFVGMKPADDAAFIARVIPGAQRVVLDDRGSLWRLPDDAPAGAPGR